jgi:hypothetical protein
MISSRSIDLSRIRHHPPEFVRQAQSFDENIFGSASGNRQKHISNFLFLLLARNFSSVPSLKIAWMKNFRMDAHIQFVF